MNPKDRLNFTWNEKDANLNYNEMLLPHPLMGQRVHQGGVLALVRGAPAATVRREETTVCMAGGDERGDTYMYDWRW